MRIGRGLIIGAAVMLGAAFAAPAGAVTTPVLNYSTYDVPGSVSTVVSGVNNLGVIAGYYTDVSGRQHGFIDTNGRVATLDGPKGSTGYVVTSINTAGTITGAYWRGSTEHAFVKTATGRPTVLDDPKVSIASQQGTFASQINNNGVIVGYYFTTRAGPYTYTGLAGPGQGPSTTFHGFVWKNGTFTTYDAPGTPTPAKPTAPDYGTQLLGLNNVGDMVGTYTRPTSTNIKAGFKISGVRLTRNNAAVTNKVTFTPIVDPQVPYGWCGYTNPTAINDSRVIVGNSANGCAPFYIVFESTGGVLTDVYVTPHGTSYLILLANSINNNALIGGTWYTNTPEGDVNSPNHGFTAKVVG